MARITIILGGGILLGMVHHGALAGAGAVFMQGIIVLGILLGTVRRGAGVEEAIGGITIIIILLTVVLIIIIAEAVEQVRVQDAIMAAVLLCADQEQPPVHPEWVLRHEQADVVHH